VRSNAIKRLIDLIFLYTIGDFSISVTHYGD